MAQIVTVMASADQSLRVALRQALRSDPGISPLYEASHSALLLSQVRNLRPSLLLLDINLQAADEEPILPQLRHLSPDTHTLLFCERLGWQLVTEAVEQGAQGCVLRNAPMDEWRRAVRAVVDGQFWFESGALVNALNQLLRKLHHGHRSLSATQTLLTEREKEIIRCVSSGMTNKEVGHALGISDKTVKTHLQHVFGKLKVGRRVMLLQAGSHDR